MVVDERLREEVAEEVLAPDLQQELLQHEGRWVAMTRTRLIAVGDSADAVLHEAAAAGFPQPIVYFVPRDGHSSMFF